MSKSLTILVVILIALFAVYYLVSKSEKAEFRGKKIENFVGLDSSAVNQITITTRDSTVSFKKSGGEWMVEQYGKFRPVEPGVANEIVRLASDLSVGPIVSSNPDKQALYQVDSTAGRLITFSRDGARQGELIVGKSGADFQSSYVRLPGSDDVYLASHNITRLVQRPVDQFRDKAVIKLDPGQIKGIKVSSHDYNFTAASGDSLWELTTKGGKSATIPQQQMQSWLAQIANLRVNSFLSPDSAASIDFSKPTAEVEISVSGSNPVTIQLLKAGKEASDYFLKTSLSDELYSVREWVYKGLIKDPKTLGLKDAA